MKESDWKLFRKRVPEWRERYIGKMNIELINSFNVNKTETEKFWHTKEKFDKIAKILVRCLDGHSRSNMELFMIELHNFGLIFDSDLEEFSSELRKSLLQILKRA
jgi:hypothetical protein